MMEESGVTQIFEHDSQHAPGVAFRLIRHELAAQRAPRWSEDGRGTEGLPFVRQERRPSRIAENRLSEGAPRLRGAPSLCPGTRGLLPAIAQRQHRSHAERD